MNADRRRSEVEGAWTGSTGSTGSSRSSDTRRLVRSADRPGLLAPDLRPKRAYKVLRALFEHEWRTHARGDTDAEGRFHWRGFRGTYEVVVVGLNGSSHRAAGILQGT